MQKYSNDEKILLAIYAEWLNDVPDMDRVNPATLEMDEKAFWWAMMKLKIMGLIDGFSWQPMHADSPDRVLVYNRTYLLPTREGVERAAELADAVKDRRGAALQKVYEIFRDLGVSTFTGFIAKYLGL